MRPAARLRFKELMFALRDEASRSFVLAELSDLLTELAPRELADEAGDADLRGLSPYLQNYVAAMVEQTAYQKAVAPPAWVRDIPPLEAPHFATELKSLRLHLLVASPVPFRRRNIFIDSGIGSRV